SKAIAVELALPSDETKAAAAVQPPRNLRLNQFGNGLAVLSWDPSPSQKVTNYTIQMAKGGAGFQVKKTVSANELLAELGGLDRKQPSPFQVCANGNDEKSPPTNTVPGTGPLSSIGPLPLPPANPGAGPANDATPTPAPGSTPQAGGAAAGSPDFF